MFIVRIIPMFMYLNYVNIVYAHTNDHEYHLNTLTDHQCYIFVFTFCSALYIHITNSMRLGSLGTIFL